MPANTHSFMVTASSRSHVNIAVSIIIIVITVVARDEMIIVIRLGQRQPKLRSIKHYCRQPYL